MLKNFRNIKNKQNKMEVIHHLKKKKWMKRECHGCKSYNPECKRGVCSLYPYRWMDIEKKKEEMIYYEMKKAGKPDIF